MKKALLLMLMFTLAIGFMPEMANAAKKAPKPTVGQVVTLNDVITGSFTEWTKETAVAAAEKGVPFVLLVGKGTRAKIYFVFNEDGTFAGKKLAKYAFNKKVGILGKVKTKNGIKTIIAEDIQSME